MNFALAGERHLLQFRSLAEMQRRILFLQLVDRRGELHFVLAIGGFDGKRIDGLERLDFHLGESRFGGRKRLACRHPFETRQRRGISSLHVAQLGLRLALQRENAGDARIAGVFALKGEAQTKLGDVKAGDTAALARLEGMATGETLSTAKAGFPKVEIEALEPVYALAIETTDRKDEVKLTAAIHKLQEEDPSLHFRQTAELQEMSLAGQGEIHLKVSAEKLASKYGLKISTHHPKIPYKETIRKPGKQHGRHKRQSGGHGQFGDVHIEIKPLPRGTGFVFEDQIKGGVVPRQFIPSVEKGVIDYLKHGPLGF